MNFRNLLFYNGILLSLKNPDPAALSDFFTRLRTDSAG
jgi:hypothetical protein